MKIHILKPDKSFIWVSLIPTLYFLKDRNEYSITIHIFCFAVAISINN